MKRLILCCDGTWNRADQQHDGVPCPTNVVRLGYRVAKRDGSVPQIVYYDEGVGAGNVLDRFSGGAFGHGLEDNIDEAYRFLIGNYEPGDQIFLFGFSRGAFTARSIAGMIRKCGILRRDRVERYREARELYRSAAEHPDGPAAIAFRRDHSVAGGDPIPIRMIGVWDTVGALGIPLRGLRQLTRQRHQFHDTELSGTVQFAFHALAIDEHRGPFTPTLWAHKPKQGQTVEQVWFCGAHSDVGGGLKHRGLSDISLGWMLERARAAGLAFDDKVLEAHPLKPDPFQPVHLSKTGFYKLTLGADRPIGLITDARGRADQNGRLDPTQSVHESVRLRWDGVRQYRPKALARYFRAIRDPRAAVPPAPAPVPEPRA